MCGPRAGIDRGMLKEAARALQKIAPEDRMRSAVLGVEVGLHQAGELEFGRGACWPPREARTGSAAWWIAYAYSTRYARTIEEAEAILQQARELHPRNAHILFNLASYASATGRMEEAEVACAMQWILKPIGHWLRRKIFGPFGAGLAVPNSLLEEKVAGFQAAGYQRLLTSSPTK